MSDRVPTMRNTREAQGERLKETSCRAQEDVAFDAHHAHLSAPCPCGTSKGYWKRGITLVQNVSIDCIKTGCGTRLLYV